MFDKDLVLSSAIRAAVVNMMTNPAFVNSLSYTELKLIKANIDHLIPAETVSDQLNSIQSPEGQAAFLKQRFGAGVAPLGGIGSLSHGYREAMEPGDLAKAIEEREPKFETVYPMELRSDGNFHIKFGDEMIRQQAIYTVVQQLAQRGINDAYRVGDTVTFMAPNTDPQCKLQMYNATTSKRFTFETTLAGFNDWLTKAKATKENHMTPAANS